MRDKIYFKNIRAQTKYINKITVGLFAILLIILKINKL